MDFHYVEDVSEAFVSTLGDQRGAGKSYLTSGDYRGISEAFAFVQQLLPDAEMQLSLDSLELPEGSLMMWSQRFDSSAVREELGIRSRYRMEAGVFRPTPTDGTPASQPSKSPPSPESADRRSDAAVSSPGLWVPKTYATRGYSWITPPALCLPKISSAR
jgi:hypothetical protein